MKQKKYLRQLKKSNKENGKRRNCDHIRLSTEWVSFGKENDAFSSSYRKENINTIGISA